ncbi:hypothetical protein BABINDRAFT_169223 [Babjeviella inositovora NRRL Y-12698]|uniref:Uncharacterized protein n=1 Tax=Babjeviella inositovora NRRL Y-12698 TaxID=984486 RepID=A0A1E3QJU6_9ASCO|nr:uncharacterized protein BABINDRAFT_169223 [Babjeviella inositovora NRRL Y-12698]ODQ77352.1 hypothetical protein BABINDRAFT_169223 [Babjeviella inositovora NRRL Y-12698]
MIPDPPTDYIPVLDKMNGRTFPVLADGIKFVKGILDRHNIKPRVSRSDSSRKYFVLPDQSKIHISFSALRECALVKCISPLSSPIQSSYPRIEPVEIQEHIEDISMVSESSLTLFDSLDMLNVSRERPQVHATPQGLRQRLGVSFAMPNISSNDAFATKTHQKRRQRIQMVPDSAKRQSKVHDRSVDVPFSLIQAVKETNDANARLVNELNRAQQDYEKIRGDVRGELHEIRKELQGFKQAVGVVISGGNASDVTEIKNNVFDLKLDMRMLKEYMVGRKGC